MCLVLTVRNLILSTTFEFIHPIELSRFNKMAFAVDVLYVRYVTEHRNATSHIYRVDISPSLANSLLLIVRIVKK